LSLRTGDLSTPRPRTFAIPGLFLGCVLSALIWIFPIPVAVLVWTLGVTMPFGDVMILLMPAFFAIPLVTWILGKRIHIEENGLARKAATEAPPSRLTP
jgi:hypothetical protein